MRFLSAAHTDIGTTKKVNQDAFCIKIAKTQKNNIAFAVICDGMGGLKKGELASALVVNAFSNWFEKELPPMMSKEYDVSWVMTRWTQIAQEQGRKIMEYGKLNGLSLGTTLTALLIVDDLYVYVHVGDSRLYALNSSIQQITKDQTLVAREVESGKITAEEAKTDSRKNVLLQCVGASKTIIPEVNVGKVQPNDVFLLCSDGFRHEVSDEEIFGILAPSVLTSEKVMKKSLKDLIDLNKERNEKDNISALLIKAIN